MGIHRLLHLLRRSVDGIRQRPWLHVLSLVTLAAAFLSFSATLTAALNLDHLLGRWVGAAELTVYLRDGADDEDLERLSDALGAIDGVARVQTITSGEAREQFAADLGELGNLARDLPETTFPATAEVHLRGNLSRDQKSRRSLAARIGEVEMVEEVDVYDDWFERLSALSLVGRLSAWGLGFLALVVAILVAAAIVRAGLASRTREIEVLRLVGATNRYVRFPFLLEGMIESIAAMAIALLVLNFLMSHAQQLAGDLLPLLGGSQLISLGWSTLGWLLVGSLLAGLAGARLSLRRLERA